LNRTRSRRRFSVIRDAPLLLRWIGVAAVSGSVSHASGADNGPVIDTGALANLNLEELINVSVTSVSKKETRLQDSPAAIFVISVEDIWGQNLLGDRHSEFISYHASFLTEVPRGIVGKSPGGSDAQSNEKTIPILCTTAGRPTE
jgi:hypothetical protein